jgi:hypothetical protein
LYCNDTPFVLQFINDTIVDNAASGQGGGIKGDNPSGALVTLDNTILANNTASSGADIYGSWGTLATPNSSNNLIDDSSSAGAVTNGSNGNLVGVAAALQPLGNYGGPTQTMPPVIDSLAVNAGSTAFVSSRVDQRGFDRIVKGTVDIGAVEL